MLYRKELLDMNNSEEYKFAVKLMFESIFEDKVVSMIIKLDGNSYFGFGVEATRNKYGKLEFKYIQKH